MGCVKEEAVEGEELKVIELKEEKGKTKVARDGGNLPPRLV